MDDLYVECLVERKPAPFQPLIRGGAYGLAVVSFLAGVIINPLFFVLTAALILCIWLALPALNVEYEYLYVSRSLTIDRILSKEKRKKAAEYDLERMEIFAEDGAVQLDQYKNMDIPVRDYTSRIENRAVWVLIIRNEGSAERILLEPDEKLIHAMKSHFPHKTFFRM